MATAVDIPVVGLYAVANPDRTGPYKSRQWVLNRYPEALFEYAGKSVEDVRWGRRVKSERAMELIVASDVCKRIDRLMDTLK